MSKYYQGLITNEITGATAYFTNITGSTAIYSDIGITGTLNTFISTTHYSTIDSKIVIAGSSQTITIPVGVTQMTVKLWGGGGSADANSGGGGGAVSSTITVSPGEQYVFLPGFSGTTFLRGLQNAGNGFYGFSIVGGAGSAFFKLVGGTYQTLAIAGGGGAAGGSNFIGGAAGGTGGAGGTNGDTAGTGGGGFAGSGGTGGRPGVIGFGGVTGSTGENYIGDISSLYFSSLNDTSTTGDGGTGATTGSGIYGGAGGGGYGGGGAGGFGGSGGNAAGGGGGGGLYAFTGTTYTGNRATPGNHTDSDFVAIGGTAIYANGGDGFGSGVTQAGRRGVIIVKFNVNSSFDNLTISDTLNTNNIKITGSTSISVGQTLTTDKYLWEFTNGSTIGITMPSATNNPGLSYLLVRTGTGVVNINTNSPDFFNDNSTTGISLGTQFDKIYAYSNGNLGGTARWYTRT
jgi:hypothetical protein